MLGWTALVWIDNLEAKPVWDCSNWAFVKLLEDAAPQILEEVQGNYIFRKIGYGEVPFKVQLLTKATL